MLLTMLFDDEDEEYVSALFQVGDQVLQLKQKPHEGREYDKEKEDRQEHAMKHPGEGAAAVPSTATGEDYDSAFPNVGLIVWQAGFVLGEYLLRTQPLGPWQGQKVLELGCGTGQLGIVLALAGAAVTLTDLAHIVPLTQTNCDLNASRCSITPVCAPFMWGAPVALIPQAGQHDAQQQQQEQEQPHSQELAPEQAGVLQAQHAHQQQQQQQQPWDVIVAADVLYEPQHYKELLDSLQQLCPSPCPQPEPSSEGQPPDDLQQQQQQQQQQQAAAGRLPPPVYICYRLRRYAEHSFEAQASACGFSVTEVPVDQLHKDYQCGGYRLIRLDRQ